MKDNIDLENKDEVLCGIVRWHYYDNAMGEYGSTSERNGITNRIIEKIFLVVQPERFEMAKNEGMAWAQYEIETNGRYIDFETVPREFIDTFIERYCACKEFNFGTR